MTFFESLGRAFVGLILGAIGGLLLAIGYIRLLEALHGEFRHGDEFIIFIPPAGIVLGDIAGMFTGFASCPFESSASTLIRGISAVLAFVALSVLLVIFGAFFHTH